MPLTKIQRVLGDHFFNHFNLKYSIMCYQKLLPFGIHNKQGSPTFFIWQEYIIQIEDHSLDQIISKGAFTYDVRFLGSFLTYLPTQPNQISSDVAWPTYLPQDLMSNFENFTNPINVYNMYLLLLLMWKPNKCNQL